VHSAPSRVGASIHAAGAAPVPHTEGTTVSEQGPQEFRPNDPSTDGDFDPYRYGRPDPNPSVDAFGRPIPTAPAPAPPAPPPVGTWPPPTAPSGGWPPPPPGYYPYPPPRPSNGMATAGLVLGIVALALCWLTVLDIPLVILGITFAAVGLKRAKRGAGSRGMALTGLICSLTAAVLVTVILIIVVPKYIDCYHKYGRDNTEQIRQCVINGN
jgi:hypothetical protein